MPWYSALIPAAKAVGSWIGSNASWLGPTVGSLLSGQMSSSSTEEANIANVNMQYDFAKHGVQWRVDDAKRSGLHPLAAIGANTNSPYANVIGKDYSYLEAMGQAVGKGFLTEKAKMELALLQSQKNNIDANTIATLRNSGRNIDDLITVTSPSAGNESVKKVNISGQPQVIEQSNLVPAEVNNVQAGVIPQEVIYKNADGTWKLGLSQQASEPIESSWPDQFSYILVRGKRWLNTVWYWHNPEGEKAKEHRNWLRKMRSAIDEPAKKGYVYRFDPWKGGFVEVKDDGRSMLYTVYNKKGIYYGVGKGYRSKITNPKY